MTKVHEELWTSYRDEAALARYEDYAVWTVPSVFPRQLDNVNVLAELEHDYQSDIGQMVTSLTNKLMVGLFPFNKPFFRVDAANQELPQQDQSALNTVVTRACNSIFRFANYAKLVEALMYLIVTGNTLLYREVGTGRMVAYSPRRYITRRDWAGTVRDAVICEEVQYNDLPEDYVQKLAASGYTDQNKRKRLKLWTHIEYGHKLYTERVFVGEVLMQEQSAPLELCPYIPMVWKLITGEHSGRGLVEDLAGSIAKYSELSRALTLYETESLRLRHMVNPTANVDLQLFKDADTGDFVEGDLAGVQTHEGGEYGKIKQIMEELTLLEQRLQRAFMFTGAFRDAERVTQEEIRQVVRAAEETFGGAYSQLGATVHTALAHLTVQDIDPVLAAAMRSPEAEVHITTGLAAMSRSATTDAWLTTAQELATVIPAVQQFAPTQDPALVAKQIMESNGLDLSETAREEQPAPQPQIDPALAGGQLPTPGVLPQ